MTKGSMTQKAGGGGGRLGHSNFEFDSALLKRQLLRMLMNAVMVLTLLFAVGLAGLVIRSLVVVDVFWWQSPRVASYVAFGGGELWLKRTVISASDAYRFAPGLGHWSLDDNWWVLRRNSTFRWNMSGTPYTSNCSSSVDLHVPGWAVTFPLITAMFLVHRARVRRKHRVNSGLCARCGYDLRATPDRCPECGSVPGTWA
ncbi:MAG TPA: hypothetical protein VH475_23030 [Tepidisphaeraceae bacterium]|jgi:hypothetical protein